MPGTTRVFIFSDSVLHAAAWQALLHDQPQLTVVGRAHEPAGVPLLSSGSAILVDVRHPGPDLVAALRKSSPQAGLLFLLPAYDLSQILPLLRAGATGCIAHDAEVSDLARALIAVGRGELALPPAVAVQALAALARGEGASSSLIEPLTSREQDVLSLLARGYSNKDIAQTLFLSVRTVEAHLRNIYGKLGVRSRTEAALWALKHGYSAEKSSNPTLLGQHTDEHRFSA